MLAAAGIDEDEIKEEASEGEELPTIGYGGVERVPAPDTVETPSGPDTADAPTGPDTPEAPAPAPEPTKEEREMRDTQLLEDEKKLVNSMTKFIDSMTTIRDDG